MFHVLRCTLAGVGGAFIVEVLLNKKINPKSYHWFFSSEMYVYILLRSTTVSKKGHISELLGDSDDCLGHWALSLVRKVFDLCSVY